MAIDRRDEDMPETRDSRGSAERWGPLFSARAQDWAETWEGPSGYGTHVYECILDRAKVDSGTRLLDCGCGAGRFARMAADLGAIVAGIDAAEELIEIATQRTPEGEFRVGDIETLPWPGDSFDWVTGLNAFQFADDKARALAESKRVSKGPVAIVIPSRAGESGITTVFQQLFPLFPPEALESLRRSGIFALSAPGKLEDVLATVGLTISDDEEIETPIAFDSIATAVRAFVGAGPTAIALQHSGESTVTQAVEEALAPFSRHGGDVTLPGWYRVVLAR